MKNKKRKNVNSSSWLTLLNANVFQPSAYFFQQEFYWKIRFNIKVNFWVSNSSKLCSRSWRSNGQKRKFKKKIISKAKLGVNPILAITITLALCWFVSLSSPRLFKKNCLYQDLYIISAAMSNIHTSDYQPFLLP